MANVKITDLTAYTNPASTDVLPIVDVGADITKQVSIENLLKNAGSGTAAAPGIAFDGDSNTGIYRPGADQLALSTNGTGRINVEADGDINIDSGGVFYDASTKRLAIGTTSPNSSLHLNSNSTSAGNGGLRIATADSNESFLTVGVSTSLDTAFISSLQNGTGSACPLSFIVGTSSANERMRIDSSGRLLVGTSTSYNAPSITGTQHASLNQIHSAAVGIGSQLIAEWSTSTATGGSSLKLAKSNSGTVGSHTALTNNMDIGSLVFAASDGTSFINAASILSEVDGPTGANDMPGRLVFSTTADGASSPTSRLVIKESGDIVIPATSATKGLWLGTGDSAGNSANSNYRIGQNSTGVGSATFYIGNAAIQVSSDARLKENIRDTTLSAIKELQKVRIVDFTWNDPSDMSYNNRNARGTWTGVIAQELVEIFPFAVNAPRKENDLSIDHDSDSTWTVEQQQLVPILIKAIQEQQVVIADLQNRVAVLEAP